MNSSMRPVLLVAVASVLALCLFGLHFTCSPVDLSVIRRNEELTQLQLAAFHRQEDRQQVVRELIDRRCTLAEALAQYEELDKGLPDFIVAGPEEPSGGNNKERRYRLILEKVEEMLHDRPEELAKVVRRLEKEYQQLPADIPTPSAVPTERIEPSR
jgi:flagellar biosynthesis/type III secretory pathway M-ring protein FliF/YscJ